VATDYNGGRDLAEMVAHVNEGAGTHRAPNGGLLPTAGRLPELDEIAAKFVAAGNKAALVAEATELAAGLKGDAAKKADAYLKAFAKVVEKGAAWLAKETARLDGMLASEAVGPAKKTEMALKRAWGNAG
jgi:protein disulfide-isomerase A6